MRQHMPQVVAMIGRERELGRSELVNECWRRGVLGDEPGWFFARENGVSVGVPSVELLQDPTLAELQRMFPGSALLMLQGNQVSPAEATAATDAAAAAIGPRDPLTQRERREANRRRELIHGAD